MEVIPKLWGNRDNINCIWKNNKEGIRKYCIWKSKKGEIWTSIVFERRRRGTVRTRGCKSPAPWGGSPGCWGEFIMPQQWPHLSHWWGGFCVFFFFCGFCFLAFFNFNTNLYAVFFLTIIISIIIARCWGQFMMRFISFFFILNDFHQHQCLPRKKLVLRGVITSPDIRRATNIRWLGLGIGYQGMWVSALQEIRRHSPYP